MLYIHISIRIIYHVLYCIIYAILYIYIYMLYICIITYIDINWLNDLGLDLAASVDVHVTESAGKIEPL